MNNEQYIWNYLLNKGLTPYATAGLMGNLQAESNMRSNNVEDSKQSIVGNDEEYTIKVDNKTYTNFIYDRVGYGIAQWTDSSRKKRLFEICQQQNKSISDLDCQL